MLVIAGLLLGALWGLRAAKARGGDRLDMAQYAAGYATACALIGLAATVLLGLSGLV